MAFEIIAALWFDDENEWVKALLFMTLLNAPNQSHLPSYHNDFTGLYQRILSVNTLFFCITTGKHHHSTTSSQFI